MSWVIYSMYLVLSKELTFFFTLQAALTTGVLDLLFHVSLNFVFQKFQLNSIKEQCRILSLNIVV